MSKLNKGERNHNSHTTEIWLHPNKILGLESILLSTKEANIFTRDHNIYRQPDNVLFDYRNKTIYNIEYKCHDTQRTKARHQLKESGDVLQRMFRDYKVVNLYIHDDYRIETL